MTIANKPEHEPLSDALVGGWHVALLKQSEACGYLLNRYIAQSVIEEFRLGWNQNRITIPVYDKDGTLVNVRRCSMKPRAGQGKMIHTRGYGSPVRLNFLSSLERESSGYWEDWIVIAGGEWDALSAIGQGIRAVCGTSGEGAVPLNGDLELLRGQRVAVVLDNDQAGRVAALKWCAALENVSSEVRNVTLPREGMDLNDWFTDDANGGSSRLMDLIEATPRFGERRSVDELLTWAVANTDAIGSRNRGGFDLACQMRDEGYTMDEAWALALRPFQALVAPRKSSPYTEAEARQSMESAYASPARPPVSGKARTHSYPLTELGNAERLVTRHGSDMRYIPPFAKWFVWDSRRWVEDALGQTMVWAKQTARSIAAEANGMPEDKRKFHYKWAKTSESGAKLKATIELARSEANVSMLPAEFDTNPMRLNCPNGILDLLTGELRPHLREDYCRKMIPVAYDPAAEAPTFDAFLRKIQPDPAVRGFLQRAVGYSLTGRTSEQKLLLLHGTGANGKSTLVELIHDLLGDYATLLPAEALAHRTGDRIPNDIARLDGARFVSVMEFEDTGRLNERLVKQLTGGDTMTARFMRGEFFDFRPQFTLWVSSNHRPVITGSDDGIWRRFLVVSFPVKISKDEIDASLHQRIRANELPGILRWAVAGALAWHQGGLNPPASVLAATEGYREDSDLLGAFLEEECDVGLGHSVTKADLYESYIAWSDRGRLRADTKISFGRKLRERSGLEIAGVQVGKGKVHVWQGIGLRGERAMSLGRTNVYALRRGSDAADQATPGPADDPRPTPSVRVGRT